MRVLSAADAISPAVQRTKEFLFRPFKWGTYLKLCIVAVITEGISANSRLGEHGGGGAHGAHTAHGPMMTSIPPAMIAGIIAAVLAAIVIGLVIFYLVTRLRFAFFDCLVNKTKEIRPGWHIYRDQANRFFKLNLMICFLFLAVVVLIAMPFAAGFFRLFHSIPPGGHPNIAMLVSLALPLIPIFFLLVLAVFAADMILRDFMLPHYALDNASSGEAWKEVVAHIKAEKGQFFVYALLRVLLPIVAVTLLFIVLIIPTLVLVGSVAALELGVHSAFAGTSGLAAFFGIFVQAFFGVVVVAFAVLISIILGGPISAGIRNYSLVFYGGRYQALGDALYPPPPPPAAAVATPVI